MTKENVDHPSHYGGKDNPLEVIKIIEHYRLPFHLGTTIRYVLRAGNKDPDKYGEDLHKAVWYLLRKLASLEGREDLNHYTDAVKKQRK